MKVRFSKDFERAMDSLSGKIEKSVSEAINNVIDAVAISQINNCKKIQSFNSIYRIKIGSKRAFFVLHILIDGDLVAFEYLVNRGEAYSKKNMDRLRNKDI